MSNFYRNYIRSSQQDYIYQRLHYTLSETLLSLTVNDDVPTVLLDAIWPEIAVYVEEDNLDLN